MKSGLKLFIVLTTTLVVAICIGIPSISYLNNSDFSDSIEGESEDLLGNPEMAASTKGKAKPRLTWAMGSNGGKAGMSLIKMDIAGPLDPACLVILQVSTKSSFDPSYSENFLVSTLDFSRKTMKVVLGSTPKEKILARLKLDCSGSDNANINYSKKVKLPATTIVGKMKGKEISAISFLNELVIKTLPTALSKSKKTPADSSSMPTALMTGAPSLIRPLFAKQMTKQGDIALQVGFSGSQPIKVTWMFEKTNSNKIQEIKNVRGFEPSLYANGAAAIFRYFSFKDFRNGTIYVLAENKYGETELGLLKFGENGPITNNQPTVTPTGPAPQTTANASPTATNRPEVSRTPVTGLTNTPVPTATRTPGTALTNTPIPTATRTPGVAPTLTPTPRPTATSTPVVITVRNITLACNANDGGELVTSYIFEEKVGSVYIVKGTSTNTVNPSLAISNVSVGSHTYVVKAVNSVGTSPRSAELVVVVS